MRIRALATTALLCTLTLISNHAHAITLNGGTERDVIWGGKKGDVLNGGDEGGGDGDYLFGKGNATKGKKSARMDRLSGGIAGDSLFGGRGADILHGDNGGDAINDDVGKGDRLFGDAGPDLIMSVDGAKDTIDCGNDVGDIAIADPNDIVDQCETVVQASGPLLSAVVTFGDATSEVIGPLGNVQNYAFGRKGNDDMKGGPMSDTLFGGPGRDDIDGRAGDDFLVDDDGGPGDFLFGGSGANYIYSADGAADIIVCGGTADYVFADPNDRVIGSCTLENKGNNEQTVYLGP